MTEGLKLILCSFGSSFGLSLCFRIEKKSLLWAALGGALTRCAYLILCEMTDMAFLRSLFAAMCAALYAEILAMRHRMPSTVYLYPSILPLVPGGTLYYIAVNLILGDMRMTLHYVEECALALGGMCLGFVLISTFTYYRRLYYMSEQIEHALRMRIKQLWSRIFPGPQRVKADENPHESGRK